MDKIILQFIHALRKGGMTVSLSEAADALTGLSRFGVADEEKFYQILRATLLKEEGDRRVFDLVYRIFFKNGTPLPVPKAEKSCDGGSGHGGEKGTGGMNEAAKRFYGAVREKDGEAAAAMLEKAFQDTPLGELTAAELMEQLKISLGWFMTAYALKENHDQDGQAFLGELETYLALRTERTVIAARGEEGIEECLNAENLKTKDFTALSESQVKAMEKLLSRLGKKLASRYSYRLKPAKRGLPDMRRILEETAHRGHLPAELKLLDRVKNKPSLLILCDISGSMAIYSSFCLQLVYAMARRFAGLRSFLFIDNIVETSLDFQANSVAEAVVAAMEAAYTKRTGRNKNHCTTTGISDYGKALEQFNKKFGASLNAKTTVLILGDAKSNWFPPKPEELREIRAHCKKLIWLNPEPIEDWNKEDSVVKAYAPYCDQMLECRNLNQLEKGIRQL
ncbi:MAG TPA: VWA domain-containing protein [Clostridiales bacterium]|nr:VWA domain-containing protein [Clostridiales bacterium]